MPHQSQTLHMHAGTDLIVPVQVTDNGKPIDDPDAPGAVVSLLGVTEISFIITEMDEDNTRLITKLLSTGGVVITDPDNGIYEATIDRADSVGLLGWKRMESNVIDSANKKFNSLVGLVEIQKSVAAVNE